MNLNYNFQIFRLFLKKMYILTSIYNEQDVTKILSAYKDQIKNEQ